ncbi:MAG: hypothetical protein A6F72_03050 [Cycloclasticus sp. symbiont of Poecilosclerida sp. N]|nr:MAG: hypothetical protein A6F72_03050 [Cycloclasticus sp. symbiont of Poecilosclerida sp. N]
MRKIVALLFILIPASQSVLAADWQVMQTVSIASPKFDMKQENTTSSRQAVNGSVLSRQVVDVIGQGDSLSSVTQKATFAATSVTLTQSGSTNSTVQTVNLASAPSIIQLEQTVEDFSSAKLTQNVTGSGNVQALNYAEAGGIISDATQAVTGVSVSLMKSATTPAGNIQAVNYMKADRYSGVITQTLDLSGRLSVENGSSNRSDMRINSINGDTTNADNIIQTVKIRGLEVDGNEFPTIILNHVGQ